MMLQAVAVFDKITEAFGRPFFVPNTGGAIRSFSDELKNSESELSRHPDDYDLYHLGSFDDSTGGLVGFVPPNLLVRGSDF